MIWLFSRSSEQLFLLFPLPSMNYLSELFSPTVLVFAGIPGSEISACLCQVLILYLIPVLAFPPDTNEKSKIHFMSFSSVREIPVFSSSDIKCQPIPCGDDKRYYHRGWDTGILTTDSFGGLPVRKQLFFPVLVPRSFSKLSQYVSALCFILFLGRNHHCRVIPYSINAPNGWPAFSDRYSS